MDNVSARLTSECTPYETAALHFRSLGIRTKNDATLFLVKFACLMFSSFQPEHLDHAWLAGIDRHIRRIKSCIFQRN
jgi:hypothetical protein